MSIKVEFTRSLNGNNWSDLRIALNERNDNLLLVPDEEQKLVLEKLRHQPEHVYLFDEFVQLHEMAAQIKKLWKPKQKLLIYFFTGEKEIKTKVLNFAKEWSDHCSIEFEETEKIEKSHVRISFNQVGSWSYVGTDAIGVHKSKPTMNFGWLDSETEIKEFKRVVLHEFGHVLGLIHEHQSPAKKVNWNKPWVYWYFRFYHDWSSKMVDINIINEFEKDQMNYTDIDKKSIMSYYIPPQFTIDSVEFPMNYILSEIDKSYIGKLYPKDNLLLS